jgi:hypothetical protein
MMKLALAEVKKQDVAAEVKRSSFQEIPLVIDRPAGFVQTGTAPDGTSWERTFRVDNGFIERTLGGDGEGLDVFLGPEPDAQTAHWITQRDAHGAFDEFKVMLGFADQAAAVQAYLDHVPQEFFGGVNPVSLNTMKSLLGIEPPAGIELQKAIAGAQNWLATKRFRYVRSVLSKLNEEYPDEMAKALVDVLKIAELPVIQTVEVEPYEAQVIKDGLPDRICKTAKVLPEQHYLLGIVLEPDVVDSQGDTYSAKEIEATSHSYMMDYRNVGLQHMALVNNRVKVVESWLAKADLEINGTQIKAGTWLMAVKIFDPELWAQIKSGELSGFSIAGFSTRTPIA